MLPDGTVDRNKSRLVARGNSQQYGVDFGDTFGPVIKATTVHTVLGVAESKSWTLRQLDVNHVFLQARLTDEVYMAQPPGFVDNDRPDYVCHLNKAIYGLKQSPRAWYHELKTYLLSAGFQNSIADTSLFVLRKNGDIVYLLVYVDDIIVTGSNNSLINVIIASLATRFSIKDLGDLHYFLGIKVTRNSHGLHLMQSKYISDLLNKVNMQNTKAVSTPLNPAEKLSLNLGKPLSDPSQYRTVVGSLEYLSFTRPDIAYAVNKLSQYMHSPTDAHWTATKRVLRYLAGTMSHGILLRKNNPLSLHAYSDADWAGDRDDFVSTNAYVVYLGGHPISWSSKKQKGVSRSSTEAEYRPVANTAAELR